MAEDALARAREIAARLSGGITGGSDLGKRKNRWEDDAAASGPGLGSVQRKKIYIPVHEHPDINFLGLIIGPKGASQKQMSESTGAKILIRGKGASKDGGTSNTGHPDDNDELHVYLEGTEDAVRKATAEVEKLFNPEYANRVKQQQLGAVAGSAGGGTDNVYGPGSGDAYQIELRVPNNMVGLIIGKGGENIVRIQSQLGVHAQIAKEHDMLPGETLRSIVLKGTPANVNEAKSRIDEIINAQIAKNSGVSSGGGGGGGGGNANREMDHAFVVKLPVPNDKVGIIIGRGGMTIKGIQERTRAHVQIPLAPDEENPQVRTLSIGGDTKEAVDSAQMEIFMTLQVQQQQAAQNQSSNALMMMVPDDKVGIIIGKGGATIKDIQNRHRVRVQIPPAADAGSMPPMRTISITGPAEGQPIAKYEIEMILAGTPVNGMPGGNQYGGGGGQYGGGGGQYGQQAQGQWGQQAAYGAQAASNSYYGAAAAQANPYLAAQQQAYGGMGAYYGAAGAAAANPYMAAAQTQGAYGSTAAAAAPVPEAAAPVPTDHTAYYNDFWQYSTYYGEAAARVFYGAWSPPEGTPPPPGIVVATPEAAAATLAAASAPAAAQSETTATAASSATAISPETATAAATSDNAASEEAAADPEVAAAAWEAYKKQYAEWYEAHGKAAGADPNPPEM